MNIKIISNTFKIEKKKDILNPTLKKNQIHWQNDMGYKHVLANNNGE